MGLASADGAMHERRRTERRSADDRRRAAESHPARQTVVPRAELHEQVVRMLVVDERRALERLAGLEDLRRSDVVQRERLERDHRGDLERAGAEETTAGSHQPVRRLDGPEVGELPLLVVELEEQAGVPRPFPGRCRGRCRRGRRGGLRRHAGARGGQPDERRDAERAGAPRRVTSHRRDTIPASADPSLRSEPGWQAARCPRCARAG